MNFKRFGLGKQLINPSIATYGKYIDANGVEQTSASGLVNHTDYISVTANRLYTVSYDKPPVSGNTIAISWYDNNKIFIKRDSEIMPFEMGRYKFTKTAPNNSAFAIVNFTYFSAYTEIQNTNNYIFAIGDSQLPYEPYGNTWNDTPHYIHNTSTDTLTTLPAVLYPNDTTATVGLKGDMEQSSQPSPLHPIQPSECGERTGNLFPLDANKLHVGRIENDGTIDYEVGTITISTDSVSYQANTAWRGFYTDFIPVTEAVQLTVSPNISSSISIACNCYDGSGTFLGEATSTSTSTAKIFTLLQGTVKVRISFTSSNTSYTITQPMLNTGSTALPYEPWGIKIPISSANTTTPVYLGEVQTTRKIKKLVLDGTENWVHRSGDPPNEFFLEINTINIVSNLAISTHYINQDSGSFVDLQDGHILVRLASSGDKTYIGLRDSNYPATSQGKDQLKEWLAQQYAAGTPVCVWYVLATPQTAVVNEPLRKIGDYADEVSGITIPTIAGANTISVGTTLQPSEVTVNYHGWHPVSAVHERESGEWT